MKILYDYLQHLFRTLIKQKKLFSASYISFKIIYSITYSYKYIWSNRNASEKYAWLAAVFMCDSQVFSAAHGLHFMQTQDDWYFQIITIINWQFQHCIVSHFVFCRRKNGSIIYELQFRGLPMHAGFDLFSIDSLTQWQIYYTLFDFIFCELAANLEMELMSYVI